MWGGGGGGGGPPPPPPRREVSSPRLACNGTGKLLENLEEDRKLVLIIISYGPCRFLKIQSFLRADCYCHDNETPSWIQTSSSATEKVQEESYFTYFASLKTKWVKLQKVEWQEQIVEDTTTNACTVILL